MLEITESNMQKCCSTVDITVYAPWPNRFHHYSRVARPSTVSPVHSR